MTCASGFVQRATICTQEPDAFERSVDMIRKLRDSGDTNGYTATSLVLVDWSGPAGTRPVTPLPDLVPEDVRPPQFFAALIERILTVTPVSYHVAVRELRERRQIPVEETDSQDV